MHVACKRRAHPYDEGGNDASIPPQSAHPMIMICICGSAAGSRVDTQPGDDVPPNTICRSRQRGSLRSRHSVVKWRLRNGNDHDNPTTRRCPRPA